MWRREQLDMKLHFLRNCLWHSHRTHTSSNNKKRRFYFFLISIPFDFKMLLLHTIIFFSIECSSSRRNFYFSHHFLEPIYKMHSTFLFSISPALSPAPTLALFFCLFSIHYLRLLFRLVIALLCRDQKRCSNEEEIKARELQLNYYYTF